jgi:hypothetical protein
MTIEVGWTALSHLATWVRNARVAAKDRKQQRFAHVIEHAGVIVAGFRQLNARANRLLLPLAYFYPQAWPEDKRNQWADDLILFAHDDVILPRMRTSIAALRGLIPEIDDHDTYDIAFEVLAVSVSLFSQDDTFRTADPEGEILFTDSVGKVLGNAEAVFHPDMYIQDRLPELISLLRTATEEPEAEQLRELSKKLLGRSDPGARIRYRAGGLIEPSRSAIAPYAEYLQSLFGSLLTQQSRLFPALPSPDWVWID